MSRARDLLERFRPVGTPGPAGAAGVPVDRARELTAELGPVFDALAPTEEECAAVRAAARVEADRRRAHATERARGLVEAARRDVEAQRADAAARVRRRAEGEAVRVAAAAEVEATAIAHRAARRTGPLVERVVAAVRAEADAR